MKSCPYCAQTDTYKDQYGYCKKYRCFEVSGTKEKLNSMEKQLSDTIFLPNYKRNQFDGTYYNPQKEERIRIQEKIFKLLNS